MNKQMDKQAILNNVAEYSAEQLAEYIQRGIVTLQELISETEGQFRFDKRKKVQEILQNADPEAWQRVQSERSVETCAWYLNSFPTGKYRDDVRQLMNKLKESEKDDNEWKAVNKTDLAALQDFIRYCPANIHIPEAVRLIDDVTWNTVDKTDLAALQNFIRKYPRNGHVGEANELINAIINPFLEVEALIRDIHSIQTDSRLTIAQKDFNIINIIGQRLRKNVARADFLDKIREDHNLLSSGIIKKLVDQDILTVPDLHSLNINQEFIDKALKGVPTISLSTISAKKLEGINKQSTEIYFWGIPSSGKSCALGAILSVANSGKVAYSMAPDTGSQGYGYMNRLMSLFHDGNVGPLIEGTAINSFYEMGFDLVDTKRNVHPITCIDMAGELMRCMYKYDAGEPMSDMDLEMLDTLTKVLIDNRSVNRKIHVFVIEYGAEDRLYEGLPQHTYLDGAVSYIKKTGIFKKDTDAIYLMISKVDKAKDPTPETFNKYIEDNYLGFYNALETICNDNEINGGKVEKVFFSLGDVCFQNYCKFNAQPAANMVRYVLLGRTAYVKGGRWHRWVGNISK